MNWAIDVTLLVVIALFVLVGVRRGFVRSAARFLGTVVAAFLASTLGGRLAQWVYDALFRASLVEKIEDTILLSGGSSVAETASSVLRSLPGFIQRALEAGGVSDESIRRTVTEKSGEAAELIADALSPVFVGFLRVLAVILLFVLFIVIVRVLSDMLGAAFHLPVLRQLDGLLGGTFGLLLALLAVFVAVAAMDVFTPMLTQKMQGDLTALLDRTVLAGRLYALDPLKGMFQ